ncbi:MAG: cob(I)yrinic acid a,c-diamide adenosyltransferase [Acidimicrobiales bacterium]
MRIYTRRGDDGTTGLLFGGRVPKGSPRIEVNGVVDEAQAALGVARAEAEAGSELDELLVALERDLYVLMAEVATSPEHRDRLVAGTSLVTPAMVAALEARIDDLTARFEMLTEFVVPGDNRCAAALDVARTVVRRAERSWDAAGLGGDGEGEGGGPGEGSQVGPYLNRLSDLVWTMARWQEGDRHLAARTAPRRRGARGGEPA